MKLTANQANLSGALSIVGRAVNSRTSLPVLNNILLATDDNNRLKLSATNRILAITCWIGANVEDAGAITIPARLLAEFVGNLPDAQIRLELTERTQTLHLECGKFKANIKGVHADEFPLIPTVTDAMIELPMDRPQLVAAINRTTFAASHDENRPTLTGVLVDLGDTTRFAATDGFRLSVCQSEADATEQHSYIVPASSLDDVAKIAAEAQTMAMYADDGRNQLLFVMEAAEDSKAQWQRCEIVSELIDAKFPQYEATVPKSHETAVTVSAPELHKATRVALLFVRDNANIVKLTASGETLRISATSAEMGDNVSELQAVVNGPEIAIAFNAKLLIDALSQFCGDVVIGLTQPTRPGILYAPGKRDEFYHLIMPMHLPKGK